MLEERPDRELDLELVAHLVTTRAARSEWPPRLKKLSAAPTRVEAEDLLPDLRDARFRRGRRCHELLGRPLLGRRRRESARGSSLPFGVSGSVSTRDEGRRHHECRQALLHVGAEHRPRTRRPAAFRDDVRDEAPVAGHVLADRRRASRDVGVLGDHRLDLAELDPEAADLDLVVDAPEVRAARRRRCLARSPRAVEPARRRTGS